MCFLSFFFVMASPGSWLQIRRASRREWTAAREGSPFFCGGCRLRSYFDTIQHARLMERTTKGVAPPS